jgi:PhnB protein
LQVNESGKHRAESPAARGLHWATRMSSEDAGPVISLMLAVADARLAAEWYQRAFGATELWNLGSVVGLEIAGAPLFLAEPANNGWDNPAQIGTTTVRVEVFVDDPDAFVARAVAAGANASRGAVRNHEAPWGTHRQGSFYDPFGHLWLVGDKSPLSRLQP